MKNTANIHEERHKHANLEALLDEVKQEAETANKNWEEMQERHNKALRLLALSCLKNKILETKLAEIQTRHSELLSEFNRRICEDSGDDLQFCIIN